MTEPRERAVQELYEADQVDGWQPPPDLTGRALRLVNGVLEHRDDLDSSISVYADRWRIDRMPVVDRAILRLALYELRHAPDVPTAVILNEAVRIAKAFSTENSGRFVNGVLASLARAERPSKSHDRPPGEDR
ncbi:MAG: transcription antitermination factor NusB [Acidimicrobiia bacterium]|nr:transcription antitermination factor NusB [Acidimicrobiia bacterium]